MGKSGQSMTPRTIWFGKNGQIYTNLGYSDGIYRFDVNSSGKVTGYEKLLDGTYHDYALGEDGNLYYASGKNLMVYAQNKNEDDLAEADRINEILKNVLLEDPALAANGIKEAFAAYSKLSNVQKCFVDNPLLLVAKRRMAIALIHNLPQSVTQADSPAVEAARNAYDALTTGQQERVPNYGKLLAAEYALGKNPVPTPPDTEDPGDTPPSETEPDNPWDDPGLGTDEPDPTEPGEGPTAPSQPENTEPTIPQTDAPNNSGEDNGAQKKSVMSIIGIAGGVLLIAAAVVLAVPPVRKKLFPKE